MQIKRYLEWIIDQSKSIFSVASDNELPTLFLTL